MFFLKLIVICTLIGAVIWSFSDPGYEPVAAIIIAAGALLAIRANENAQVDKRQYKPKK